MVFKRGRQDVTVVWKFAKLGKTIFHFGQLVSFPRTAARDGQCFKSPLFFFQDSFFLLHNHEKEEKIGVR